MKELNVRISVGRMHPSSMRVGREFMEVAS